MQHGPMSHSALLATEFYHFMQDFDVYDSIRSQFSHCKRSDLQA